MIHTIYRVEVEMTQEITDRYDLGFYKSGWFEYDQAVATATSAALHSGQDTISLLTEWAEFDFGPDAIRCNLALEEIKVKFTEIAINQLKETK